MAEFGVQCQTSFRAPSFEVTDRAEKNNVRGQALDVRRSAMYSFTSVYAKILLKVLLQI